MRKYYTKACNFSYNSSPKNKISTKYSLPLNGSAEIYFDSVEIITRNNIKKIKLKDLNKLNINLKNKIYKDIKNITKKKLFKKLNFTNSPLLMGVLNLTPDSFSDGGKFNSPIKSLARAKKLFDSGCDILDIGGESTRPGSHEISSQKEWLRISKSLKKISKLKKFISIDTRKEYVMRKANKYNINLINDISGLNYDHSTLDFLKKTKIPFVIHHIKGTPLNMQNKPNYKNVLLDIYDYFEKKLKIVRSHGITHNNIILDPGIGFGKNLKHNITILKNVSICHSLGYPLLLGTSRKRFIKDISGLNDSKYRIGGTLASCIFLKMQGVQILRVHDINEIKQGIKIFRALKFNE